MKVHSWGRNGWKQEEKQITTSSRNKVPYCQPERFETDSLDPMSLFMAVQEGVQYGCPIDKIDELPNSLRMIYESSEFYNSPSN
jgi:hypothetical protein